ncbi:hypothetical protein BDBG_02005 [Blastomyces gilchristii SLH14081]|uniref:DUF2828 domain-containing protein n=1 Tax=Blastomyces gilchristii (strain SLH14081) TaxID=559298 RepID=A0A179UCE0_BLAGS|nr:uncharacterized protein BDBG_02005 [Blastomyces gilchristii SLH14081]OAT05646.1 hypothetical protein BDBG_02005 [Blastomyces gilchristii SLH14081]
MDTNNPSNSGEERSKGERPSTQLLPPAKRVKTSSMDSSFPVLLPEDPCIRMSDAEFEAHIFKTLPALAGVENAVRNLQIDTGKDPDSADAETTKSNTTGNSFVDALDRAAIDPTVSEEALKAEMARRNRMLTTNNGMAFASTQSPLLELFNYVDGDDSDGDRDDSDTLSLAAMLEQSWQADSLMTLKIIWAVRSIHLGKGDKTKFYQQLGWLGQYHPRTLLRNLKWLYRPVVKKDAKEREGDEQVVVENVGEGDEKDTVEVDDYGVIHSGSHGYWKDLLNILVLSVEGKLDMSNPDRVLLVDHRVPRKLDGTRPLRTETGGRYRRGARADAQKEKNKSPAELELEQKAVSRAEKARRREKVLNRLATDPFHRALHLTVARLFAEQLRKDMLLLESGTKNSNKAALREISLCAKWAPSLERFHDKYTLIASTISELLFPKSALGPNPDSTGTQSHSREVYLKRARENYRAHTLSPLRKALAIVERDISAKTFSNIEYSKVPSLAMNQYKGLFQKKDTERFKCYIEAVQKGDAKISGAILTPGLLVKEVWPHNSGVASDDYGVADAQWKTLVQRIKDSGTLSSAIALCDVSGSMEDPLDRHRIGPLHNAIGLSLVMAEVTKPPFGGRIITFSEEPKIHIINGMSLAERVENVRTVPWGQNTDFIKVFRDLLLPLAVENKIPPEDMVKTVFVFSDMEFDEAQCDWVRDAESGAQWQTHHQIVEREFRKHGYEVPQLVYWNLAARAGAVPVTFEIQGTALVSGQSQALMKVFLDGGMFGEEKEEDVGEKQDEVEGDGDGEWAVVQKEAKKKTKRIDPMKILRKLVGHEAFDMLRVVD